MCHVISADTSERQNPLHLLSQLSKYWRKKEGPLTNNVADFLAWEKVPDDLRSYFPILVQDDLAHFPEDWPEIEYLSGAGYVGNWDGLLFKRNTFLPPPNPQLNF